jgi:LL-diaminopimelate aminotransferase
VPLPPAEGQVPDLIFLCFPNNPTGAVIGREELAAWVAYARLHGSVILYDAAYESYTTTPGIPRSIYEIPGARSCAIEFKSFSKTAGFTGVRGAYTVVPRELERDGVSLHALWSRRQATRFNGVSYITQRGAAAVFTPEGREQTGAIVRHYMDNARIIREGLADAGFAVYGGVDAPYVWIQTPGNTPSWAFFDVCWKWRAWPEPRRGLRPAGEGYFR